VVIPEQVTTVVIPEQITTVVIPEQEEAIQERVWKGRL
jgi:hypothetical protein